MDGPQTQTQTRKTWTQTQTDPNPNRSSEFPAGTYYIGDLGFVLKEWDQFCAAVFKGSRSIVSGDFDWKGKKGWLHHVPRGRGKYRDGTDREYVVETGLIGVIPTALITHFHADMRKNGNVTKIADPFICQYADEGGVFTISNIVIRTGGDDDVETDYQQSELFQAGTYFVGDPSLVIKEWPEFCDLLFKDKDKDKKPFKGGEITWQGSKVWLHRTAYGDGGYYDNSRHRYSVDSGLLGIVPQDKITKKNPYLHVVGNTVEFAKPFHCEYLNGTFAIGHIVVFTGDEEEIPIEDADEDDYETEEDEEEVVNRTAKKPATAGKQTGSSATKNSKKAGKRTTSRPAEKERATKKRR
jgi:hypothetical protein